MVPSHRFADIGSKKNQIESQKKVCRKYLGSPDQFPALPHLYNSDGIVVFANVANCGPAVWPFPCFFPSTSSPGHGVMDVVKWVSFFFAFLWSSLRSFLFIKKCTGFRPRKLRGRMSLAEGCGRGCWISWCSSVSMSHIEIWFWMILGCSVAKSLRFVGLVTGFASVFCGSRAEASRKHRGRNTCPNNGTPRRCLQKVSKPKANERSKRKRLKWKELKSQKAKMKRNEGPKGQNERKWNQPHPGTLENVVALWSRKQKLRKQGRGSSRKGYVWNVCRGSWRCGRGSIAEAVYI